MDRRVRYARMHLRTGSTFQRHVFLDEAYIQLYSNTVPCYVPEMDRYGHIVPAPKFPPKISIIAGISWRGSVDLVILEPKQTIDGALYREYLEDVLFPWGQVSRKI